MSVTSPRSPWTWQSPAPLGYGRLITLFCLVCLAVGSPVKREDKMSHHQRSTNPVLRAPEKPAAHFQANPSILDSLTWTTETYYSFSQGNLSLEDNKLLVKHRGLYFIYSQAMFGGKPCPQQNKNLISLNVMLDSVMENAKVQLLRADKTPCEQPQPYKNSRNTPEWRKSIFLGAVFHLEKGDKLYVKTLGTEFLRRERGTTYFGAYAL
ncbi:lymphotoxin-alpha-like [Dendrobates tinctorius]|uniref:lymphotoxin-alpha-like n=1 Tax=Dendrobates tinctorius TaxID=92724 RepID=UPI003CC985B6